ncbi:MAG: hypothetical protein KA233_09985 [Novosphingobium sp.]|jgi:hypothetical protein|nr:hypothetical protein [Novosphingobium sp.]MBP6555993.1 hypothetical protein [Novosphingobium sp.]
MDFFKALLPGSLLTFVVSALMGKGGSRGGWLYIERIHIDSHSFYWSWTLFVVATVLAWILFAITPK